MFIVGYGVSSLDIMWVQLVYAVWNVVNDLIGGYFADWYNHKFGGRVFLIVYVVYITHNPLKLCICICTLRAQTVQYSVVSVHRDPVLRFGNTAVLPALPPVRMPAFRFSAVLTPQLYTSHAISYICLNDGFFSVQAIVGSAVWVDDLTSNENERIKLSLVTKPIGFVVGFVIIWYDCVF